MQTPEERGNGLGRHRWNLYIRSGWGSNSEKKAQTSVYIGFHNITILIFIPTFDLVILGGGRSRVSGESYRQESAINPKWAWVSKTESVLGVRLTCP